MADTIAEMVVELREALSVDASYDTVVLPAIVKKAMTKLLRDYHFPKSLQRQTFQNLILNSQEYTLPVGFKKEHLVLFYDPTSELYGEPLTKRGGITPAPANGQTYHYWLEGPKLITDLSLPLDSVGISLILVYESMDVATNESWFVPDFEDVLFALSMVRAASQLRKANLVEVWQGIWREERTSLAIYANELQYDNSELIMRAPAESPRTERYAPNG